MPQVGQLVSADASDSLSQARSQQALQQAKLQQSGQAATGSAAANNAALEKSAKAFEAILLDKWLEQAEHSFGSVPGGDPNSDDGGNNTDGDPGADQFRSLAMQSLAEKITDSGGIGIAAMMMKQLRHNPAGPAPSAASIADSKALTPPVTNGVLPARNGIKVPTGKDR